MSKEIMKNKELVKLNAALRAAKQERHKSESTISNINKITGAIDTQEYMFLQTKIWAATSNLEKYDKIIKEIEGRISDINIIFE